MFKSTNINIGTVQEKKTVSIDFFYDTLKKSDIVSAESSCGCGVVYMYDDRINVQFTPGEVPLHLLAKNQNHYDTAKNIWVKVNTITGVETTVTLLFTGVVKK